MEQAFFLFLLVLLRLLLLLALCVISFRHNLVHTNGNTLILTRYHTDCSHDLWIVG